MTPPRTCDRNRRRIESGGSSSREVTMLLLPVAEAGLKLAVTPVGKPVALSPTAAVRPPDRVMLIVLLAVAPR